MTRITEKMPEWFREFYWLDAQEDEQELQKLYELWLQSGSRPSLWSDDE